jgi:D-sedoheptulose 7-phosphate isomerase
MGVPNVLISSVPVALLAGGLATRLRPITEKIPKALVDVAGRPFIDWQLDLLAENGIRHVVMCLGYLGEMVRDHCGDGSSRGMRLDYSFDGEKLMGTGGALLRARHLLGDAFWVMYGDSYMDIDYRAVHDTFAKSDALGLMTVLKNGNKWDTSNVIFEERVLVRYDKKNRTPEMQYIDYGVALLRAEVLDRIPVDRPYDLAELYTELVAERKMIGYEVAERFYEIGTPESLEEARRYLQGRQHGKITNMSFSQSFLKEVADVVSKIDAGAIESIADKLRAVRDGGGRLFFLGVGGSAGNCNHAVNDFRKIAGFEAYAPTDNVSELTARTNDEGWETVFVAWLKGSRLRKDDGVFVFSVGGGSIEKNVSPNLVRALQHAKEVGATVVGIIGRDGGYTAKVADAVVIIPTVNADHVTPHSEAFQAVVWHLLVSHPKLKAAVTKWESTK